jgi:hypothetical protein
MLALAGQTKFLIQAPEGYRRRAERTDGESNAALTFVKLQRDFSAGFLQLGHGMRDILQNPVDGDLSGIAGQVQHARSLADRLAELKAIGDLFAGSVNE